MMYPLPAPVKLPGTDIKYTQVPEYSKFNIIPVIQPKPTRPKNLVFFEDNIESFDFGEAPKTKKSKLTKYFIIFVCCIAIFAILPYLLQKRRK